MKAGGCVQVEPNPQPRADLTGGGVRIGHDSAAEVLRKCSDFCGFAAVVQRGPSCVRQSWADARTPGRAGEPLRAPVVLQIRQR